MSRRVIRRKKRPPEPRAPGRDASYRWSVLAALTAVALAIAFTAVRNQEQEPSPNPGTSVSGGILVAEIRDPRVGEVERRFYCPCGQCGGKELAECGCDAPGGAQELKAAIVASLDAGNGVDETVAALGLKYPGALKAPEATERAAPFQAAHQVAAFRKAAEQIACPCGECQLRLLDCSCTRDRGANEVKAFVRAQVSAGRTVPEILAAFERVYGKSRG